MQMSNEREKSKNNQGFEDMVHKHQKTLSHFNSVPEM